MAEAETPARELSRRLMSLCDENVNYLRGAVAAATAISDLTFGEAAENGAVRAEHIGLRWALDECEAAVVALSEDLHAAHRLALEQAGGATPERRLAEVVAEAGAAQADLAAGVRDLRGETLATLKDIAERVGRLEARPAENAAT